MADDADKKDEEEINENEESTDPEVVDATLALDSDPKADSEEEKPAEPTEKAPGDWITAQVSSEELKQAVEESTDKKPASEKVADGKEAAVAPAPESSAEEPVAAAESDENFLAKLGLKDEKSQRTALIVGGVTIFLCCACSCAAVATIYFFG